MSAVSPPGHLSEVLRFLSSTRRAQVQHNVQAYNAFHSSFYNFLSVSKDNGESFVAAATNTRSTTTIVVSTELPTAISLNVTCTEAKNAPYLKASPLARQSSSAVSGTPYVEVNANKKCKETLHPQHRSPPPPLSSDDAPLAIQRTATFCDLPSKKSPSTRSAADSVDELNASIGSIELPAEQQPDGEFLSPSIRQELISSSNVAFVSSEWSFRAERAAGKPKALSGFAKPPTLNAVGAKTGKGDTNEFSHSASCGASFSAPRRIFIVEPMPMEEAQGSAVTPVSGQCCSQVFQDEGSLPTFPGMRRVSLRRPVFEEDDDYS
ncbi:hypothetical protein ABB37_00533 [Leptomonas pyrrhocoris]|uniref:Uncharacterized protein n=1 Tax=Leptomonas pyrrhocoris TaxID=157538 RepID=A0A0M9GAK1_LEPPY|nr:hypothetical protein ABB37_00533 [Leptomonas pyrrhocoris]KPA86320.1 hypothetical protein ABB37_00533 [Leptomonas pyrrhocoris]|eukprot:XP_015664759.1 hypothetical protein ABB37_00533 [Leptomonas pyrrhocoris]